MSDNYLYVFPIYGITISEDFGYRYPFCNVEIIRKKELFEELLNLENQDQFFEKNLESLDKFSLENKTDFFITIKYSKQPIEKIIEIVQEKLQILALSKLFWDSNNRTKIISLFKEEPYNVLGVSYNLKTQEIDCSKKLIPLKIKPLILSKEWRKFHENNFFLKLLSLLSNKEIDNKIREKLKNAAVLAGESQNSLDRIDAFIKNFIVLEMFIPKLTKEKDKDSLIKGIEFLLGWNEEWKKNNMEEKITNIYKKRCNYVHDGKRDISVEDLNISNLLVFNIFSNLILHENFLKNDILEKKITEFMNAKKMDLEEKEIDLEEKFRPYNFKFSKPRQYEFLYQLPKEKLKEIKILMEKITINIDSNKKVHLDFKKD